MNKIKFEVSKDLLEEMAECIHLCDWVSEEEVLAYMISCINNNDNYDPKSWSESGRGLQAKSNVIEVGNE